ncbi:phage tail terminator-like protein [Pseudoroseomonas cervicalis]|uniref:phage tail terminator-like protein n=1 Tax=Teichococcus cervicalis TaxID=204525 RepID=UPI00278185FF|nr:phage tail terminator-like protein [Pseudoroseomonas cervicalis]MDQ1081444.1 hypothetical protein [Pseudoroseomonas cervicalis]
MSDIVFEAVEALVDAEWTGTPVAKPNRAFAKPQGPWIRFEVTGDIFQQQSIGAGAVARENLWRETGSVLVHLFVPAGDDTKPGRRLLRQFVDLLVGQELGAIEFTDASFGMGHAPEDDGNWWILPASIGWTRDE